MREKKERDDDDDVFCRVKDGVEKDSRPEKDEEEEEREEQG